MSIDKCSNSASTSKTEVTSKYFSKENDKDDSLSEFQEKKKNVAGPKKVQNKPKKKPLKQIKGQKDIRSLIKNNDLVKYSKDFDNLCKKSGIDVDSEQLQLAIALSKSLQDTEQTVLSPVEEKPLTSQEKIIKIRTTLQEYGFKVPQTKVEVNKRIQKRSNNYKLLQLSESEKQQRISDKYAQVLLNSVCNYVSSSEIISTNTLYYKTTNILYEDLKNTTFLVSDLHINSSNNINLLRSWSEIPGRPSSPVLEGPNISFNDIDCSQEELDNILSGSTKRFQELLQRKLLDNLEMSNSNKNNSLNSCPDIEVIDIDMENSTSPEILNDKEANELEIISKTSLSVSTQVRSDSPDLFDDEDTVIMDVSRESITTNINHFKTINIADTMDLTECVHICNNTNKTLSQNNVTRKKSNDFMEITDCVQTVPKNPEKIDLTQDFKDIHKSDTIEYCDNIDLTCNYEIKTLSNSICIIDESEDNLNVSNKSDINAKNRSAEINLKDCECDVKRPEKDVEINASNVAMDLTQSSDSSEELPEIKISGKNKDVSSDDTIIMNEDCYEISQHNITSRKDNFAELDLISENEHKSLCSFTASETDYEVNSPNGKENDLSINKNADEIYFNNDINLTQSFNLCVGEITPSQTSYNTSKLLTSADKFVNLGKKDDISIDYDEMFDNIMENYSNVSQFSAKSDIQHESTKNHSNVTASSSKSEKSNDVSKIKGSSNNEASSSSLQSKSFELSDKEFNYSINNFRNENFDFGGLSVLDNFSGDERLSRNSGVNNSYLPPVNLSEKSLVNGSLINIEANIQITSPLKSNNENYNIVKTPGNNEYIIKEDQVTPMPNYERMSTPEIHQELDKYGVRPFKRKRAIKLLNYIYNQTHPIVDSCIEENLTPSKKLKPSATSPKKKSKSPQKSPRKKINLEKENNLIYEQTNKPIIKNIECSPEDWAFQKREKAKVHSCRVPLHIAFHNYVSSSRTLHEAILCYEPINIDVVHKDLVASGYRYNPKDLLKYMDKKCITVKTADNNARNKR